MEIICIRCRARQESNNRIAIREEDQSCRCPRCGRRYRLMTGDLAQAGQERSLDAESSEYILHLAQMDERPKRMRIIAKPRVTFERSHRFTIVWHRGRLIATVDQTSEDWIPRPARAALPGTSSWRTAWVGVGAVCVLMLAVELQLILDRI